MRINILHKCLIKRTFNLIAGGQYLLTDCLDGGNEAAKQEIMKLKQRLGKVKYEMKKNRDPRRQNQEKIKEVNMPVLEVTMLNNIISARRTCYGGVDAHKLPQACKLHTR